MPIEQPSSAGFALAKQIADALQSEEREQRSEVGYYVIDRARGNARVRGPFQHSETAAAIREELAPKRPNLEIEFCGPDLTEPTVANLEEPLPPAPWHSVDECIEYALPLIAAAPALLSALKGLVDLVVATGNAEGFALVPAIAAITKAEGRTINDTINGLPKLPHCL